MLLVRTDLVRTSSVVPVRTVRGSGAPAPVPTVQVVLASVVLVPARKGQGVPGSDGLVRAPRVRRDQRSVVRVLTGRMGRCLAVRVLMGPMVPCLGVPVPRGRMDPRSVVVDPMDLVRTGSGGLARMDLMARSSGAGRVVTGRMVRCSGGGPAVMVRSPRSGGVGQGRTRTGSGRLELGLSVLCPTRVGLCRGSRSSVVPTGPVVRFRVRLTSVGPTGWERRRLGRARWVVRRSRGMRRSVVRMASGVASGRFRRLRPVIGTVVIVAAGSMIGDRVGRRPEVRRSVVPVPRGPRSVALVPRGPRSVVRRPVVLAPTGLCSAVRRLPVRGRTESRSVVRAPLVRGRTGPRSVVRRPAGQCSVGRRRVALTGPCSVGLGPTVRSVGRKVPLEGRRLGRCPVVRLLVGPMARSVGPLVGRTDGSVVRKEAPRLGARRGVLRLAARRRVRSGDRSLGDLCPERPEARVRSVGRPLVTPLSGGRLREVPCSAALRSVDREQTVPCSVDRRTMGQERTVRRSAARPAVAPEGMVRCSVDRRAMVREQTVRCSVGRRVTGPVSTANRSGLRRLVGGRVLRNGRLRPTVTAATSATVTRETPAHPGIATPAIKALVIKAPATKTVVTGIPVIRMVVTGIPATKGPVIKAPRIRVTAGTAMISRGRFAAVRRSSGTPAPKAR
ncbi:hypothetical protein GCM10009539_45500 [Cryptosporangium japonicum]|uniref:Uncharacterized protein n=1 Tax=Cryptosporangium japonicum TaxID=80872 RepID=A0ABP3EAW0_9ACTN